MVYLIVCLSVASGAPLMENVREHEGTYTLAPGPSVEGVVLVQQGDWPPDVIRTFYNVPWLDAASIRLRWAELEPELAALPAGDEAQVEVTLRTDDGYRTLEVTAIGLEWR